MTTTSLRRGALVRLTLTSVGVPVVIIGLFAWFFMSYRLDVIAQQIGATRTALVEGVEGRHLIGQAQRIADTIDRYVVERIAGLRIWASDPLVVNAARAGAERHEAEGLVGLDPEALEARAPPEKSLRAFPETDQRLHAFILAFPDCHEMFFTDVHGLNVATTNPTSDMLQSDEGWWQQAWRRGLHIGEVEYDASAAVWSVALSLRIDDPDDGAPLGVLKAVLALDVVRGIADRTETTLREDGNVQVAERKGRLIAETKSGHAPERLMQEEVGIADEILALVEGGEPAGLVSGDHMLTAFARTPGGALYEAVAPDFSGLGWIVVVREATNWMEGEVAMLVQIEGALQEWRLLLAAVLAGIAGASILMAALLAVGERSGKGGA